MGLGFEDSNEFIEREGLLGCVKEEGEDQT